MFKTILDGGKINRRQFFKQVATATFALAAGAGCATMGPQAPVYIPVAAPVKNLYVNSGRMEYGFQNGADRVVLRAIDQNAPNQQILFEVVFPQNGGGYAASLQNPESRENWSISGTIGPRGQKHKELSVNNVNVQGNGFSANSTKPAQPFWTDAQKLVALAAALRDELKQNGEIDPGILRLLQGPRSSIREVAAPQNALR